MRTTIRRPEVRRGAARLLGGAMAIAGLLAARPASAVPSFARQSGIACSACHNTFPELNDFARAFKLHGYTLNGMEEIKEPDSDKGPPLEINRVLPLAVELQTALTRTNAAQRGTQNGNVEFPQQLSLFLAGEI